MSGGLLLVDGNACAMWTSYAVSPRLGSKGRLQSALHGVMGLTLREIRTQGYPYVAVLLEEPFPFRLRRELLRKLLCAAGIPVVERRGRSVRQVAAALIVKAQAQGVPTTVVTTKTSFLQLVGPHLTVVNPARDCLRFQPHSVESLFGVLPSQIPDWLALTGDPSEGIPGVKGIGPKRASELLKQFGSVKVLLNSLHEVPPSIAKRIVESRQRLDAGYGRAKIRSAPSDDLAPGSCALTPPDPSQVSSLFRQAGMADLLSDLLPHVHSEPLHYQTVLTHEQLQDVADLLARANRFAIDTETTGLNVARSELVGISIAVHPNSAFYIPVGHRFARAPEQLPVGRVAQALRPSLEDTSKLKIGQNLKFDLQVLRQAGFSIRGPLFDTMVASYLLNPDRRSHSLDALSLSFFGFKMIPIKDLIGEGKTMADVEISVATEYACEDADVTLRLYNVLAPQLDGSGLSSLFYDAEMPLLLALADVEEQGVLIDRERVERFLAEAREGIQNLCEEIFSLVGERFDPESPKEIRRILGDSLRVEPRHHTRTRQLSINRRSLQALAGRYPVVQKLIQYQDWTRFCRVELPALMDRLDPSTGRLSIGTHQAATGTGRLGLSRFSDRTKWNLTDLDLRSLIKAPDGYLLLQARYRQLMWRLIAEWSGEPELLRKLHSGQTIPEGSDWRDLPRAKLYFQRILLEAKRQGRVSTLLKRVRVLPELNSPNLGLRLAAEQEAIETRLQGSTSDLMKLAIVRVWSSLQEEGRKASTVLILEDGLLLEVPESELDAVVSLVKKKMEQVMILSIPLIIDVSTGIRWSDLVPVPLQ